MGFDFNESAVPAAETVALGAGITLSPNPPIITAA